MHNLSISLTKWKQSCEYCCSLVDRCVTLEYLWEHADMFSNQKKYSSKTFLFYSYLRDIRKFKEEEEWQVLKFNNFPINAKFSQWGGSLHLHNIPRSILIMPCNWVYLSQNEQEKWNTNFSLIFFLSLACRLCLPSLSVLLIGGLIQLLNIIQ